MRAPMDEVGCHISQPLAPASPLLYGAPARRRAPSPSSHTATAPAAGRHPRVTAQTPAATRPDAPLPSPLPPADKGVESGRHAHHDHPPRSTRCGHRWRAGGGKRPRRQRCGFALAAAFACLRPPPGPLNPPPPPLPPPISLVPGQLAARANNARGAQAGPTQRDTAGGPAAWLGQHTPPTRARHWPSGGSSPFTRLPPRDLLRVSPPASRCR